MKVDFTKTLLNFKGELLKDGQGRSVLVKDIVCSTLSSVTDASKDDKKWLTEISDRIWASKEATELLPEEVVLIRKYIEILPANVFTQIYNLLG